jgi:alpha-mannosidase II
MKREILSKIPLQGNYYPIPGGIFIEDDSLRLSLFTSSPLGGSSLHAGEIEIMQDRRLNQDDERGLGQGVMDNRATLNIFKLVLESRESCRKLDAKYPAGYLTSTAYMEQKKLLHPFEKLIYSENEWNGVKHSFGNDHEEHDIGFEIAAMRSLSHIKTSSKSTALGIVVHRTNLDKCSVDTSSSGNQLNLKRLLGFDENEEAREIYRTTLTMLEAKDKISDDSIAFCPMDVKGFILK